MLAIGMVDQAHIQATCLDLVDDGCRRHQAAFQKRGLFLRQGLNPASLSHSFSLECCVIRAYDGRRGDG